MRKFAKKLFVLAVALVLARTGQAQEQIAPPAPQTTSPAPVITQAAPAAQPITRFYVQADCLWLKRTNSSDQILSNFQSFGFVDDSVQLRTGDPSFNYEPGLRITVGAVLNDLWSVDLTYWGLQDHSASATTPQYPNGVGAVGPLQPYWATPTFANNFAGNFAALVQSTTNPTQGFTNAYQHLANYSSEIHNAEINFRRNISPYAAGLFGIRYIHLNETFEFISIDENPANDGNPGGGNYTVKTNNNLIGGQLGGELNLPVFGDRLLLTLIGKGGLYANFASQDSQLYTTLNNTNIDQNTFTGSSSKTTIATVLEVGFNATFRVTNAIAVRGGYNAYFINSLALAPENFSETPFVPGAMNSLNNNGQVLYHGPSAGLEIRW